MGRQVQCAWAFRSRRLSDRSRDERTLTLPNIARKADLRDFPTAPNSQTFPLRPVRTVTGVCRAHSL